jgi:predicted glutamine amidotransferase
MAYMGNAQMLSDILFSASHSIVVQSLTSTEGAEPTNGDGFGVGWYSEYSDEPALYRTVEPAWHDKNMSDLSKHIRANTIFAHVRAASPSCGYVQQTNCHPFRYKNWLFMHNGVIRSFKLIRRELMLRIDPELFKEVQGTTDSEVFFYLALTFGLIEDPPAAMTRTVAFIEKVARENGATKPIQMTVCTTDGNSKLWAFRFSSERKSRTLYYSSDKATVLALHPNHPTAHQFSEESRFIVSEPLGSLPGVWNLVPESSCVVVNGGSVEILPFDPVAAQA